MERAQRRAETERRQWRWTLDWFIVFIGISTHCVYWTCMCTFSYTCVCIYTHTHTHTLTARSWYTVLDSFKFSEWDSQNRGKFIITSNSCCPSLQKNHLRWYRCFRRQLSTLQLRGYVCVLRVRVRVRVRVYVCVCKQTWHNKVCIREMKENKLLSREDAPKEQEEEEDVSGSGSGSETESSVPL